jgi:hypothetical protein
VTSATADQGLAPTALSLRVKDRVLLFFIVFQVIVSQKIEIVNILEDFLWENF